jgi:hypothetical protein
MASTKPGLRRILLPRDPLFRLLAVNGIAGLGIAALVLGGIFYANIGNLRVLVMTAEDLVLPVLMLACGFIVTLGSVVIGSAIMLLGDSGRNGGTPRQLRLPASEGNLKPVPVSAAVRRRNGVSR